MPAQKDDKSGRVTLVIFRTTWRQLCRMADVETRRETIHVDSERKNVQTIQPVGFTAEATFWVCAAMLLGNADAMMLAAISRRDQIGGFVWFDGLEVA